MEKKVFSIPNYGWIESKMGSVDLCLFEESGAILYGASISLSIDDGSEQGHWVFMETGILGTCKHCVAKNAASMVALLTGNVISKVSIFDENGGKIEDIDLNDEFHSHSEDFIDKFIESETQKRTLQ